MRTYRHHAGLCTALLLALSWGCGAHGPTTDGSKAEGDLLQLHGEGNAPSWEGMTPASQTARTPERLPSELSAFDYWQITDRSLVADVWGAVFPVLETIRTDTSETARRRSLDLLLEAIEPRKTSEPTRLDVTFVVGREGESRYEGVACRLFRTVDNGGTPTVTLLLLRRADTASTPARILVWASPDFREVPTWTADFRRRDDEWNHAVVDGLRSPSAPELTEPPTTNDESTRLAARVLTRRLWDRFTGTQYAGSTRSSSFARPDGIDEALGLELADRRIDQVYSDTAFPPRAEIDLGRQSRRE